MQPTQIALGSTKTNPVSGLPASDILELDYTYNSSGQNDNNGNVLSQTIKVPAVGSTPGFTAVETYTYDSLNRIHDAKENINGNSTPEWKQTFTYDRFGNRSFDEGGTSTNYLTTGFTRTCSTSSYNPNGICDKKKVNPTFSSSNNQIIQDQDGDSINDYLFDASGNTTKDADSRTFVYDAENKQIEVKNSSNQTIGQYWYDGDGKRVKKYVPSTGETTIFTYDASRKLVEEYSTIVETTDPKVSYLTTDHLGSPRINTDQNGAVIARHDYQPFGEEVTRASYGADTVRKKFTGYEREAETPDLDFAQARMYANKLGRFSTPDPIILSDNRLSDPQRINLYIYVKNNPLRFTDPTGEDIYQLGKESVEEIKKRIKEKEAELKKDKKNQQLKDELNSLNNDLKTVREGNRVVGAWLDSAHQNGELKDVKLSDLKITTDPVRDLAALKTNIDPGLSAMVRNDPATVAETIGSQIYVFTPSYLYQNTLAILDGTVLTLPGSTVPIAKGDIALVGGSYLIHEQKHVTDNRLGKPQSEIAATDVQVTYLNRPDIVKKFKNADYRNTSITGIPKATY